MQSMFSSITKLSYGQDWVLEWLHVEYGLQQELG